MCAVVSAFLSKPKRKLPDKYLRFIACNSSIVIKIPGKFLVNFPLTVAKYIDIFLAIHTAVLSASLGNVQALVEFIFVP